MLKFAVRKMLNKMCNKKKHILHKPNTTSQNIALMMMLRFRSKERNKGSVWEVLGGLVEEEPWLITLQNLALEPSDSCIQYLHKRKKSKMLRLYLVSEHPTQRAQLMDKKRS